VGWRPERAVKVRVVSGLPARCRPSSWTSRWWRWQRGGEVVEVGGAVVGPVVEVVAVEVVGVFAARVAAGHGRYRS
jgi:hypothetical protein